MLAEAPLDLLEKAREGSLFLHEVGDLNRMEQKGLMLLLGKVEKYNARLICASAKPLAEQVAQGSFDARLYSAIATVALHVPNLREHREDIPDLANLYLLRCIEAKEVAQRHFSTAALNALRNFDWPGNLAQLESTVRSLALTAANEEISVGEVNQTLAQFGGRSSVDMSPPRIGRLSFQVGAGAGQQIDFDLQDFGKNGPITSEVTGDVGAAAAAKGRIVMATVKGDVHDIGKNIVGVVLDRKSTRLNSSHT